MMKKSFIVLVLSLLVATANARPTDGDKSSPISVAAELGGGILFANSNISPYGVGCRSAYGNGFSANVKMDYALGRVWTVGVKYNYFTTSADYGISTGGWAADDVTLHYVGPQVGLRYALGKGVSLGYAVGVGCMLYDSNLLESGEKELEHNTAFLAANVDMSLSYRVRKGLYLGITASVNGGQSGSLKQKQDGQSLPDLDLDKWDKIRVVKADVMFSIRGEF